MLLYHKLLFRQTLTYSWIQESAHHGMQGNFTYNMHSLPSAAGLLHFEENTFTMIAVSSNNREHLVIKTSMEF